MAPPIWGEFMTGTDLRAEPHAVAEGGVNRV